LKGLPATCPLVPCNGRRVALAQARRAGDISKRIPPGLAVVKYVQAVAQIPFAGSKTFLINLRLATGDVKTRLEGSNS
jgi:hypothetical protein